MSKSRDKPSHDPSVQYEPHLAGLFSGDNFAADSSASAPPPPPAALEESAHFAAPEDVDHTVWDEPSLAAELTGSNQGARLTYARWLEERIAATSFAKSMWVTCLLVLAAGPFGVLGALLGGGNASLTAGGLVAVAIIGPVTEEVTKIALAMWVAERRPYLFKAIWQILLAAAAGGFLFGFIENLLYLYVYIPDHSQALADFRWSVCMGLHVNCSFIAGVGVARMWNHTMQSRTRPDLSYALPWIAIAVAGHGAYNLTVTLLEVSGWLGLD